MLSRLQQKLSLFLLRQVERLHNSFYIYLALLLTTMIALDASLFHVGENMRQKAFDAMVRHRIQPPQPDPEIIIVDVNEASLAALAQEYGRYPWPRQVFGEFVESIEKQKPKAVVFDILFADSDVYNPDSDAYFNEAMGALDNVFFPLLRLPPSQDGLSQIKPEMLPGVSRLDNADPNATIAVTLPHFAAVLKSGRIGTHNIIPDPDGVSREYRLFHNEYGWKLPSLPLVVSQAENRPVLAEQDMLLNWRGPAFSYTYVSFSDVFLDITAKTPKRPADEFSGKIVIIGSTAPSLFDLKATPMDRVYPGVEILATAIDNLRNGDHLRIWRGATPYVLLSLILIWLTAWAFYRDLERDRFDKLFGFSQLGLLGISYAGLNLANTYIDLTGPVTWAIAYFSIAKIYALATERALQRQLATQLKPGGSSLQVSLMVVLLEIRYPPGDSMMKRLARALESLPGEPRRVEVLKGSQSGLWGLFGESLLVSWSGDFANAQQDAEQLVSMLPALLQQNGLSATIRHNLLQATLEPTRDGAQQWRRLFAQNLQQLEESSN
jgi:CHASE2 domain-containing sensor protein